MRLITKPELAVSLGTDAFPPYVPDASEWRWKFTQAARERLYMMDPDRPDLERAAGWVMGEEVKA